MHFRVREAQCYIPVHRLTAQVHPRPYHRDVMRATIWPRSRLDRNGAISPSFGGTMKCLAAGRRYGRIIGSFVGVQRCFFSGLGLFFSASQPDLYKSRVGVSMLPASALTTATTPCPMGWRRISRRSRRHAGRASRKSLPRCARVTSPGSRAGPCRCWAHTSPARPSTGTREPAACRERRVRV
jgi:hypothetical protein